MPTLLKFTTFVSSTFHPKPHHSLLRRCTAVSIPSPATIPCRNFTPSVSRTIKSAFLGLRSSSQFVFNKGGRRGGGGGGFRAQFTRGGGGGGKSSGFYTDMGSESNNRDDQWLDNNDYSIASTLQQPNHNDDGRKNTVESPSKQPRHQTTKLLTLPTILTIGRVAAVPILVCTFYVNAWWGTTATTSIFIAAAITDWLDGYLARKMKLGSAFGAFLDPVADKLMVAATLVLLCTRPPEVTLFEQFPWLLTVPSIAIIGREITMSAVREWAASQGGNLSEAVAVNNLGKWKTATQMISLTILLLTRSSSLADSGVLVASGVSLLYISAWLAVWSLVVYMKKIWKVLLK